MKQIISEEVVNYDELKRKIRREEDDCVNILVTMEIHKMYSALWDPSRDTCPQSILDPPLIMRHVGYQNNSLSEHTRNFNYKIEDAARDSYCGRKMADISYSY